MRMTRLFSQTAAPTGTSSEARSVDLLLRAGFIRQLAAGIYSYLPLAWRSLRKIEDILREEMDAIGGQEISMPVAQPADIWQASGRWYQIGSEMGRFEDKNGRPMVLAMTHEEVVAGLARQEIHSYRQLPQLVYQIQIKWRDDPRPRAGLIRTREFTMKDSYSLDASPEGLEEQYRHHYRAYFSIFRRAGLPVIAVKSDVGMMGGKLAHEYMYLTPIGEDTLLTCSECGYAANQQVARFRKEPVPSLADGPLEKVATPGADTIDKLARLLGVPATATGKAVLLTGTFADDELGSKESERLVFALLRGDMQLSETKLAAAVGAKELRPATEAEIRSAGAVPGYASPMGVRGAVVVVDDLVPESPGLAVGANEEGYHFRNFDLGRDLPEGSFTVADIAEAVQGSACADCGTSLEAVRGVEVGNIFQLGTRYTEAFGASFLDADGRKKPIHMGSYGIGVGRLLACVAEEHQDDDGLKWPISIAPYQVQLLALGANEPEVATAAEEVYAELSAAGLEVLFDDRDERAGVKFKDADLIGSPIRLTVGRRHLEQRQVEIKLRASGETGLLAREGLAEAVRAKVGELLQALATET